MSDPRILHWRRHEETAKVVFNGSTDHDYVTTASACGHLVLIEDTVGDPAEANCPECEMIHTYLKEFTAGAQGRTWLDGMARGSKGPAERG